ncbi:MAG: molybdopterin molybdotransferase MoeA [Thermodesulfobacteria bacterium]|nr:molybdopterin molybdotransferase MoeA [Thermodesulfobacteriota bacterium]
MPHEFFFQVKSVAEVTEEILSFSPLEPVEEDLLRARGRFLAEDLISPEDLPSFSRATMDGYAVRAKDTFGARENEPVILNLAGEILMGQTPERPLQPGEAVRIATGGMLPEGADAVVMVEYTEEIGPLVEIRRPVAPGENVIQKGEDIRAGEIVFPRGTRLTTGRLGVLSGLGLVRVKVHRRPRVGIISTGDELVPPEESPPPGKIRDINSYTLAAGVEEAGGEVTLYGLIPDEEETLFRAVERAFQENDVVLISGGSSVGTRDFTLKAISSLPHAEILAHGVAVRPGKPTILARAEGKAIFGLPGQVASALLVFYLFVRPLLLHLQGARREELALPRLRARVTRNLPSAQGREDYYRVRLREKEGTLWAEPIFRRSGLISSMAEADGLLKIPERSEGLYEGEEADVYLLP